MRNPAPEGTVDVMAETEMEENLGTRGNRKAGFWQGVLAGVFSVFFLLTLIGYQFLHGRGISVFVDQDQVAAMVRERVGARAAQELPAILAKVSGEAAAELLPEEAVPNLALELGGKKITLPQETVAGLWREITRATRTALAGTLERMDYQPYADDLADEIFAMVSEIMSREFYGRTFHWPANGWLRVPVTVEGGPVVREAKE